MVKITFVAIFTFVVLMCAMSLTAGTQRSFSALASKYRWLLLVTLWSQLALVPPMLEVTPEPWKWLAALGMFAIGICGGANLFDKADRKVHTIAAIVAFTLLTGWVMVVDSVCLLPLIVCAACGRENWKWRVETGLVISVYMALIKALGIVIL